MRPSAISEPATQSESEVRVVWVSKVGYQLRPRNKAKVKREFTLTTPSNAIMWIFVLLSARLLSDTSDIFAGCFIPAPVSEERTFSLLLEN